MAAARICLSAKPAATSAWRALCSSLRRAGQPLLAADQAERALEAAIDRLWC